MKSPSARNPKQKHPSVRNPKKKLEIIFSKVSLPGAFTQFSVSNGVFTEQFWQQLLINSGDRMIKPGTARKRCIDQCENNCLSESVINYLCAGLGIGLKADFFRKSSLKLFRVRWSELTKDIFNPPLARLIEVEDYYRNRRPRLQEWIRPYYADVEYLPTKPKLQNFPLIVQRGFLLDPPESLNDLGKQILGPLGTDLYHADYKETHFFNTGEDYQHFLMGLKKTNEPDENDPWNGFCYRLTEYDLTDRLPRLKFSKTRYFDYVNTAEARAFEAAFFEQVAKQDALQMSASKQRHFRNSPKDIFRVSNRVVTVGVNTITFVVDQKSDQISLLQHDRNISVRAATNTLNVVPAGTFQPVLPDTNNPAALHDPAWDRDYSIRETVVREFLEECLGHHDAIKNTPLGKDWRSHDRAVSEDYQKFNEAASQGRAKLWLFGFGFDPLTECVEILTALMLDSRVYKLRVGDEEGRIHEERLSQRSFQNIINQSDRWAPAGMACMQLADVYFGDMLESFRIVKA